MKYLEYLNLDIQLKEKVIDLAQKDKVRILSYADKCNRKGFDCLKNKSDLFKLCVAVACLDELKQKYDALGIEEPIFFDTARDITVWCENNANKGLKNISWIKNHLNFELFRIGRLQYQFFKITNRNFEYDYLPFDYGENVVYVHIPQGEKLDYSKCIESIKAAKAFFEKYFPHYSFRFFFSESWLLYENNWEFMAPSSNILQFGTIFDVVYNVQNDAQAIERIFGKKEFLKSKYKEDTSLQKSAKAYLQNGGKLGIGVGVLHKDDI